MDSFLIGFLHAVAVVGFFFLLSWKCWTRGESVRGENKTGPENDLSNGQTAPWAKNYLSLSFCRSR